MTVIRSREIREFITSITCYQPEFPSPSDLQLPSEICVRSPLPNQEIIEDRTGRSLELHPISTEVAIRRGNNANIKWINSSM